MGQEAPVEDASILVRPRVSAERQSLGASERVDILLELEPLIQPAQKQIRPAEPVTWKTRRR